MAKEDERIGKESKEDSKKEKKKEGWKEGRREDGLARCYDSVVVATLKDETLADGRRGGRGAEGRWSTEAEGAKRQREG